jgi:hypothetical protein
LRSWGTGNSPAQDLFFFQRPADPAELKKNLWQYSQPPIVAVSKDSWINRFLAAPATPRIKAASRR